jgi:3-(3-hydroxy-phenyl)propionate hydroxylase
MPPPRFRFEFMLVDGDDAAEIAQPESVRELLAPWMDPTDAIVERSAIYTFHGLIAREWRKGRVLLAGDAAHMTPPFLGQGMCAGIRDAANLAWKLERVVRGSSPDSLLDTYGLEREPHVRQFVEAAVNFGRLICTTDRDMAAQRDRDMLAARAAGGGSVGSGGAPPLLPGQLILDGGGAAVVQPFVGGRRLDDEVGPRFAVLARHVELLDPDAVPWWHSVGAVVLDADTHPGVADALDAAGADVVVVRPDRYIMCAGERLAVPGTPTSDLLFTTR